VGYRGRVRQDTTGPTTLADRAQVLAATGNHPFARLTTTGGDLRAFRGHGVIAWTARWSRGSVAAALGEAAAAVRLVTDLARAGELSGVRRVNVPRIDHAALAAHLPVSDLDDWDFRWTRTPPPAQPLQERVHRLRTDDAQAIDALLERAFPGTHTRPGDPGVRCWYGVWDHGRLVACGADRSRGGVGSIAAVAVDPDEQGRGLGAALTAAMAQQVLTECDVVSLGVLTRNHRADRLYRRLGFTEASARTSASLAS
jgi:ribosomal protein S18 acetylase RimI-like enzyme